MGIWTAPADMQVVPPMLAEPGGLVDNQRDQPPAWHCSAETMDAAKHWSFVQEVW